MDNTNSEMAKENPETNLKTKGSGLLIPLMFMMIVVIAGLTIFIVYLGTKTQTTNKMESSDDQSIFWAVHKLAPIEYSTNFDLTIKSNAGAIRNYENISSYGSSSDGKFLAFNGQNGLELVELETDSRSKVQTPNNEFTGDSESSISWNFDSNYFAPAVNLGQDNSTQEIWIFDNKGVLIKNVSASIPAKQSTKLILDKVSFSNYSNLLLAGTYKAEDSEFKKDDGTNYTIAELPVYLTVINTNGEVVKEFNIRDYSSDQQELMYSWDVAKNGFIKYVFYTTAAPTLNQEHLFTKIAI